MSAAILGWGSVTAAGREPRAIERGLTAPREQTGAKAVPEDDPARTLGLRGLRPLSRASRLACAAAAPALEALPTPGRNRAAVVLGTQYGSIEPLVDFDRAAATDGPSLVNPAHFPNVVVNVHAGYLAILFGLGGPNVTVCGPSAGLEAIGQALDLLALGRADVALAGGAEALGPAVLRALAADGEGEPGEAGAFLLLGCADAPGARARLLAYTEVMENGDGRATLDAIAAALERAGLTPDDVDHVWVADEAAPVRGPLAATRTTALGPITGACRAAGGAIAAVLAAAGAEGQGEVSLAVSAPRGAKHTVAVIAPA